MVTLKYGKYLTRNNLNYDWTYLELLDVAG